MSGRGADIWPVVTRAVWVFMIGLVLNSFILQHGAPQCEPCRISITDHAIAASLRRTVVRLTPNRSAIRCWLQPAAR